MLLISDGLVSYDALENTGRTELNWSSNGLT